MKKYAEAKISRRQFISSGLFLVRAQLLQLRYQILHWQQQIFLN